MTSIIVWFLPLVVEEMGLCSLFVFRLDCEPNWIELACQKWQSNPIPIIINLNSSELLCRIHHYMESYQSCISFWLIQDFLHWSILNALGLLPLYPSLDTRTYLRSNITVSTHSWFHRLPSITIVYHITRTLNWTKEDKYASCTCK